jgi:hypothetical protein
MDPSPVFKPPLHTADALRFIFISHYAQNILHIHNKYSQMKRQAASVPAAAVFFNEAYLA